MGQERTGRFSVPAPGWKSEWVMVRGGRMRTRELATPPSLLLFWNAVCIYCPVDALRKILLIVNFEIHC